MADSRGKKRHGRGHVEHDEHEEHGNHEAWVIPYADILTLLMALFLVLFALGRTDQEKLELAAESFRKELGRSSPFDIGIGTGGAGALSSGGLSVFGGSTPAEPTTSIDPSIAPEPIVITPDAGPTSVPPATFEAIDEADEVLGDPLTRIEQTVRARAAGTGLADAIGFRREVRGLVVTIVTDQVLFDTGRAEVRPEGIRILDVIAGALSEIPNAVTIEGHTDSRPISTSRFPSNWELSTARATSVLRYLVEQRDFPADRLSAAGYADTRPIATGDDAESLALNRRVEVVVLAAVAP